MIARLFALAVLAFGTAANAQDTAPAPLTCTGVDALGRTVERACTATAPDPLRTDGVYTDEERLDTDAQRNARRLRELDRLSKPLPRTSRDPGISPEFKIGIGSYRLDNTTETRERRERERTDPYAVETDEEN